MSKPPSLLDSVDFANLPPGPPVVRQIREAYWQMGEDELRANPNMDETVVFVHQWNPARVWTFKVVRVNGQFERHTLLNGNRLA